MTAKYAVHQIVDLDALDASAHQPLIGIDGPHRDLRQRRVDLPLCARQIVLAIGLMDLLAEILEAHLGVGLGMRLGQRRQCAVQWGIGVVEILEIEELGDERAPLALGDPHREQHQERVEPGLLDLDPAR